MLKKLSCKFDDHQFGALKSRFTSHELVNLLHIKQPITITSYMSGIIDFTTAFDHFDLSIELHD
jgi:hypothetical protein